MIKHRTFQTTHLMNVLGKLGLEKLEVLRRDTERFAAALPAGAIISVTETRDMYASTVTVWYQDDR